MLDLARDAFCWMLLEGVLGFGMRWLTLLLRHLMDGHRQSSSILGLYFLLCHLGAHK